MRNDRRKGDRVTFTRLVRVHLMAIHGTWRRACWIIDVSEVGARLTVETSIEGLNLKEFFVLLSTTGLAYRRCELSWVKANELGVLFIKNTPTKASNNPPTHKESTLPIMSDVAMV